MRFGNFWRGLFGRGLDVCPVWLAGFLDRGRSYVGPRSTWRKSLTTTRTLLVHMFLTVILYHDSKMWKITEARLTFKETSSGNFQRRVELEAAIHSTRCSPPIKPLPTSYLRISMRIMSLIYFYLSTSYGTLQARSILSAKPRLS